GKTARDRRQNVAFRSGVVSGDETDAARQERQRALPFEHTFRGQLLLQPLERGEVVAEPEPLERESPQAEVALRLEELWPAEDVDALAVGEVEPQRVEARARDRDAEAGAVVG